MNQFGCPYAKDDSLLTTTTIAMNQNTKHLVGTGGPPPNSIFYSTTGQLYTRSNDGGIPDELISQITNGPGTLSMANTGRPQSGGSQFFMNVAGKCVETTKFIKEIQVEFFLFCFFRN